MLLIFASRTGNVKRFVNKLGFPSINLSDDPIINEPYVLLTYTDKFGEVPILVQEFLERTESKYLKGVAASGNRNWGPRFAMSAEVISKQYQVPIIHQFEMAGTNKDIEYFKKRVEEITHEPYGVKQ